MASSNWSYGQSADFSSTLTATKPVAPHEISTTFSFHDAAPAPHQRRPSMAHVSPSSQIIQVAQPKLPLIAADAPLMPPSQSRPSLHPRTSSFAGRKRSRDEFGASQAYDDSDLSGSSKAQSPAKSFLEDDDMLMDADVRNGSVAQELADRLRASNLERLDSRKSIRLANEEDSADVPRLTDLVRPGSGSSSHDPATLALGPSWSTMLPYDPAHAHLQSAIRGWTVYIEAQFPLRNVKFEYCKKSEPAGYLVGAILIEDGSKWRGGSAGYYLFDEQLKSCRLVAKSWNNALDCLRTGMFEGDDVLIARDHQFGYGLHGEGLDTDSVALLQGHNVNPHHDSEMMTQAFRASPGLVVASEDTGMELD